MFFLSFKFLAESLNSGGRRSRVRSGGVTGGVAESGVIVADQVNNLCAAYRGWMIYLAGDNDEHQAGK